MSTITIPAAVVSILRGALHEQIGHAGSELESASSIGDEQKRTRDYEQALSRLEANRALLKVIGWRRPARERPIEVDLALHESSLLEALHEELETARYILYDDAQMPDSRRQRRKAAREIRAIERFLTALERQLGET